MYQHIIEYYYRLADICEKANQYLDAAKFELLAYNYIVRQVASNG